MLYTRLIAPLFLAGTFIVAGCSGDNDATRETTKKQASLPSLQEKLDAKKAAFTENAPADKIEAFNRGVELVAQSGVMESAAQVGEQAPNFNLINVHGQTVSLDELRAAGPVVLIWYRGGWCPYCNIQLQAMQDALPAIKAAGGQVVAISPELPDNSLTTAQKDSLEFVVLSDPGNEAARKFGIVYTLPEEVKNLFLEGGLNLAEWNGEDAWELPLSATYIIDADGTIRYAYLDPDYKKRAEPQELVEELQKLQGS